MAIASFGDSATQRFFLSGTSKVRWQAAAATAFRKLDQLNAAARLADLAAPPGNRLEALKGDRRGQWSIRINNQWRIVFRWTDVGPADVSVVDYH